MPGAYSRWPLSGMNPSDRGFLRLASRHGCCCCPMKRS